MVASFWLLSLRVGGMGGVYIASTKNLAVTHLYAQLGGTGWNHSVRPTSAKGLNFRLFGETGGNNSERPMGDDLSTFHTSVRPIETTQKFRDEIDRLQKVGKRTSVGPNAISVRPSC